MSFQFRKLHFKGWLVYQDVTLEFPAFAPGRNLIIVNGGNGFGKTSLLRALKWLFHGGLSDSELADVWNTRAAAQLDDVAQKMGVSLEFEHDGKSYTLVRSVEFASRGAYLSKVPSLSLKVDGEIVDAPSDKISQLIPKECQQFVFFDGADITYYAERQPEDGVREAIERVLGIPAVRFLREDLEKLVCDLEAERNDKLKGDARLLELKDKVADEAALRDNLRAERAEKAARIEPLQRALLELEKQANQLEVVESEGRELEEKRRRKADLSEQRRRADEAIGELIAQVPLLMLRPALRQIAGENQKRAAHHARQLSPAQRQLFLQELLETDTCVCGQHLTKTMREAIESRIGQMKKPAPTINRTEHEIEALLIALESAPRDPQVLQKRRADLDAKLDAVEQDITALEMLLLGHEHLKVREVHEQLGATKTQLEAARQNLAAAENSLKKCEADWEWNRRQLDQRAALSGPASGLTQTLTAARTLLDATSDYLDALVEQKRATIEAHATQIFVGITNKPDEYCGVRVKPNYTLEVRRHDGSAVENFQLSAGEKEVLAYSFIAALNLSSALPAPFVMDTPFGHLDAEHRDGLLRSLPQLGVQVVLLATNRDLPPHERALVAPHVAGEFFILRDQQNALSTIEKEAA